MKKILSVILIVVLILSLSSCAMFSEISYRSSYVPDWYMGGYEGMGNGSGAEYYWVETYDEVLEAVDLLKSHGSTFKDSLIFNYEGDLFDTKYCFHMQERKSDKIKWGDNPFDRKSEDVEIITVAFFEDVTIDTLTRSYVNKFDAYELTYNYDLNDYPNINYKDLDGEWDVDEKKVNLRVNNHTDEIEYDVYYDKYYIITVDNDKELKIYQMSETDAEVISDECIDAIINSLVVVK